MDRSLFEFEVRWLAQAMSAHFQAMGASYADLLDAQRYVEPLCARLAAHHPLRWHLGAWCEATDGERELYDRVYALVDNPPLRLLAEAIRRLVADWLDAWCDPADVDGPGPVERAAIAIAIAAGDGREAEVLMASHVRRQHRRIGRAAPDGLDGRIAVADLDPSG